MSSTPLNTQSGSGRDMGTCALANSSQKAGAEPKDQLPQKATTAKTTVDDHNDECLDPYNGFYPERTSSLPFTVRRIPGKGFGAIASRDIHAGSVILKEPAVLTTDVLSRAPHFSCTIIQYMELPQPLSAAVDDLVLSTTPQARYTAACVEPVVTSLLSKVQSLSSITRARILEMLGRLVTNGFGVDPSDPFLNPLPAGGRPVAVFLAASRINHHCQANASAVCGWTPSSGNPSFSSSPVDADEQDFILRPEDVTATITASRDIAAGEEITINYVKGLSPAERRAKTERAWGFVCDCESCRTTEVKPEDVDDRRAKMKMEMVQRALRECKGDGFWVTFSEDGGIDIQEGPAPENPGRK
ncbi:hypothetical protein F4778DRAFT_761611 [Xylariomycetidae sp. FL2044]|nr:hypothetical protein F4778DRAFT_761611 [Xylariomycetidae sp. FL2044]